MNVPPLEPDMALFLDFDGTLVELAPRPEDVQVVEGLVTSLSRLGTRLDDALAIVSGRPIAEIDRFLAPLNCPAAGLHGHERRAHRQEDIQRTEPTADIRALKGVIRHSGLVKNGVALEDKGATIAVHFRDAPEYETRISEMMHDAVQALPALHLVRGKMVLEAKPHGCDKGTSVLTFLKEAPFAGRRPVFVGDDVTDEDGIAAVQDAGGIGIKVGPGETCAQYRLGDVTAVHQWLAG